MPDENSPKSTGAGLFSGRMPLWRVLLVVAFAMGICAVVLGLTVVDWGTEYFRPDMFVGSLVCLSGVVYLVFKIKRLPDDKMVSKLVVWGIVIALLILERFLRTT